MCRYTIACLFLSLPILSAPASQAQEEVVLGKKRSEWLLLLKDSKETKLRRASLIALEVIGPKATGVADAILAALDLDAEAEVRREAALTLARMGTEVKGAVEALGQALKKDKSGVVREAAASALGRIGEPAQTQVLILAAALKDAHVPTRTAAAEAIKNIGEKANLALPQLIEVLKNKKEERFPRIYAAQIMGKLPDEARQTVPVLIEAVQDKDAPPVCEAAIEALGRLGDAAAEAGTSLAGLLQGKDATAAVRRAALIALGKIGVPAKIAWPAVDAVFKNSDTTVRYQAIRVAGKLAKDEKLAVVALALSAAKDDTTENRLAAIQELAQLGPLAATALPTLSDLASNDSRGSIREAAEAAVKKIKGK